MNHSEARGIVQSNPKQVDEIEVEVPPATLPSRAKWLLTRWMFLISGLVCLGLATAGAFLPVLPCTPFVLLAVYCFARSSPSLHAWLIRSRLFGGIIADWQKHRAIRRQVRFNSVILIVAVLALSMWILKPTLLLGLLIVGLVSIGLLVIFWLPVCD
jgi:uncharacterized membrane protein YbaN (DUF454 family)